MMLQTKILLMTALIHTSGLALASSQSEDSEITSISLEIDNDIDTPSNTQVVDCTKYYKEATAVKSVKK